MPMYHAPNMIRLFGFYLALMFVLSLARRWRIYWDACQFIFELRGRWPKLVNRLHQHHGVLFTKDVLRPLGLAIGLMVIQFGLSRVVFPEAHLTLDEVMHSWWLILLIVLAVIPMLAVDSYFIIRVGQFDRRETEQYLDQAEHWLTSWKTPVLRTVTLGFVNPQRIVDAEVRKGLTMLGETISWSAWWVSVQVSCRVFCGLVIWSCWAIYGRD